MATQLGKHLLGLVAVGFLVTAIGCAVENTLPTIDPTDVDGGVFDELADRVVILFKQHMLAEMGQLSRSATHPGDDGEILDPVGMGIEASGSILKAIGLKKPPAILQYKLAQVLGNMINQASTPGTDFPPPPEFGP